MKFLLRSTDSTAAVAGVDSHAATMMISAGPNACLLRSTLGVGVSSVDLDPITSDWIFDSGRALARALAPSIPYGLFEISTEVTAALDGVDRTAPSMRMGDGPRFLSERFMLELWRYDLVSDRFS